MFKTSCATIALIVQPQLVLPVTCELVTTMSDSFMNDSFRNYFRDILIKIDNYYDSEKTTFLDQCIEVIEILQGSVITHNVWGGMLLYPTAATTTFLVARKIYKFPLVCTCMPKIMNVGWQTQSYSDSQRVSFFGNTNGLPEHLHESIVNKFLMWAVCQYETCDQVIALYHNF